MISCIIGYRGISSGLINRTRTFDITARSIYKFTVVSNNFADTNAKRDLFCVSERNFNTRTSDINSKKNGWKFGLLLGGMFLGGAFVWTVTHRKEYTALAKSNTPKRYYRPEEVSRHKTKETGIWVTYKGRVYDVTDYVDNHPAGIKTILLAAGGALEPFFDHHPVHKNEEVLQILDQYEIGLLEDDKEASQRIGPTANVACASSPLYLPEEVSQHKTKETGIWVTYQGHVYDITDFVDGHPGGDKIMLAAGGPVEPFWALYAVHKTEEVQKILAQYKIGLLKEDKKAAQAHDTSNPFAFEPSRHPVLKVVSSTPFNAETIPELLTDNLVTPNDLFFVRNHLPVPKEVDLKTFRLQVSGMGIKRNVALSVDELRRRFPARTVRTTIMCAGNRRSDMAAHKAVKGLPWGQTAISTADWTGVYLRDLLLAAGADLDKLIAQGVKHIQFEGLDKDEAAAPYGASIPVEIALDPTGEVLIAYEMNGEPLPRDHGFPLRVIMPGLVGARQVKWLHKIILSREESSSFWQQKDYKIFSPSVDFSSLDYSKSPAIMVAPVQSAICYPRPGQKLPDEGSITVKGYAWSGGGRGIVRVEVSADGGETWHLADLSSANSPEGSQEDGDAFNHLTKGQWAWTLWEVEVPLSEELASKGPRQVELLCKAVDAANNTQPESFKGTWNVRGLLANAWHRVVVTVEPDD